MRPILEVHGISKKYRLSHLPGGYLSLRDRIVSLARFKSGLTTEEFLALDDISFQLAPGDSTGIIGRNGAGKSTLLKILSRITPPTKGKIIARGRVASLLEVGTGFHQELSGRENIFFNGSLLGMKRREIEKAFDEIIDFSGTERFLDMPLKHYSSGMQLRLAFDVAAFLEPEILIIDEVLAVGDAEFQRKCIGKMESVSRKEGRTVLFVSHNMSAIENLCKKCILLDKGKLVNEGLSADIVKQYQLSSGVDTNMQWTFSGKPAANVQLTRISLQLSGTQPNHQMVVSCSLRSTQPHKDYFIAIDVLNSRAITIFQALPRLEPFLRYSTHDQEVRIEIDLPPLIPDRYSVSVWVGPHFMETFSWEKEVVAFHIDESPAKGRNFPHSHHNGFMVPNSRVI